MVGGGFAGSVIAERIATELNGSVLLIDRRDHIGGNAFDFYDKYGVLVHKYGPHIFHTNSGRVWDYISRFTEWIPYEHKVLAQVEGKEVPVPFNFTSLHMLFGNKEANSLEKLLLQHFSFGANIPILALRRSDVPAIRDLANYIYNVIFLGYTFKQWNLRPEELDPSVTGRVPVRLSYDDRYFLDKYQAIPNLGYNAVFERMLDNPNITVRLNTEYSTLKSRNEFKRIIYTGPVDAFFDYKHGELPYRSLNFDFLHYDEDVHQRVAQINFPNEHDYTRITEFKHITSQAVGGTTVAVEYPQKHIKDTNEPYYPIPIQASKEIFKKYQNEMAQVSDRITFVGRLAEYKYFNMDQMIGRALSVFENEISPLF